MQDELNPQDSTGFPGDWDADDVAISAAMQGIGVPAGASRRALSRLREAAAGSPLGAETATGDADAPPAVTSEHSTSEAPAPEAPATLPLLRRRRILAVGAAAAALLAMSVFYWQSQPLTQAQLASRCIEQLELVSEQAPRWSPPPATAKQQLAPLTQITRRQLTLIGFKRQHSSKLTASCTLWKFVTDSGKSLYVFDFPNPPAVRGLSGRPQVISESSSSWSLAALLADDRLFVIAVEGDIQTHLKSLPPLA